MKQELVALRREVEQLRKDLDAAEDWATGIQQLLIAVLPFLLRDHPNAEKVRDLLRPKAERYEAQAEKSLRGKHKSNWRQLEPQKMAYRLFEILGVWPGVDSVQAAEASLARAQARRRPPE